MRPLAAESRAESDRAPGSRGHFGWLRRLTPAFLVLLLILGLEAPAGGAQEPQDSAAAARPEANSEESPVAAETPEEADSEENEDDTPPIEEEALPVLATVIFTSDAPCSLTVAGIARGIVDPDTPLEVGVESLTVTATATSVDLATASWSEELVLEEDERREIAIPVLEAIETQRKKERRELVFRDVKRGFMWQRRDNARDVSWADAHEHCEALELGGFENWQLPSLDELETLEAMWSIRPLKTLDQVLLTACCVWTSSEGEGDAMWNLDFRFRRAFELNRSLSFGHRALCRREMPADELAEAQLAADPKERKRRLKEKRRRADERKQRKAEKAAKAEAKAQAETQEDPR